MINAYGNGKAKKILNNNLRKKDAPKISSSPFYYRVNTELWRPNI